jgi:hypothetical protein
MQYEPKVKSLNAMQKVVYVTLIDLFKMVGVSPASAIPILRALADDTEQVGIEKGFIEDTKKADEVAVLKRMMN